MNRRNFLLGVAALPAVALLPAPARGGSVTIPGIADYLIQPRQIISSSSIAGSFCIQPDTALKIGDLIKVTNALMGEFTARVTKRELEPHSDFVTVHFQEELYLGASVARKEVIPRSSAALPRQHC